MGRCAVFETIGGTMTVQLVRVLVADDHPIVLNGISALLQKVPTIMVVGVARSFTEVTELLVEQPIDVVVLDLGGMGSSPLALIQRVHRDWPNIQIVVFSSSVDLVPELLGMGVKGYVAKEDMSEDLVEAIEAAAQKRQFLSQAAENYLYQRRALRQDLHFAPKEMVVLKLLAQGLGTAEIAEQLSIDPRSAQNYITALLQKTGQRGRTQLVQWYLRLYGDRENF